MPLEVYTAGKPAAPHRALISGVVLLALTCALAGSMVRSGSRRVLGLRVAPPGWAISFQPPRGLRASELVDPGGMSVLGYVGSPRRGVVVTLTVQRWAIAPQEDSDTMARLVEREYAAQLGDDPRFPGARGKVEKIGSFKAVEILNKRIATVVRAVVLPDSRALALTLSVHGAPLDTHLHRLFDLTCRSVEFE